MNMLYINETAIIGQVFTVNDPNVEYTCIGYGQNNTFIIVGSRFDSVNNRTELSTHKLSDVKFRGQLVPAVK